MDSYTGDYMNKKIKNKKVIDPYGSGLYKDLYGKNIT